MGILTTVVGSYPVPDWLAAHPSEQGLLDAMAVILKTQENAGIDVIADGELGRFDVNHPETNGMIEYFVNPLGNVRAAVPRSDAAAFRTTGATPNSATPSPTCWRRRWLKSTPTSCRWTRRICRAIRRNGSGPWRE